MCVQIVAEFSCAGICKDNRNVAGRSSNTTSADRNLNRSVVLAAGLDIYSNNTIVICVDYNHYANNVMP